MLKLLKEIFRTGEATHKYPFAPIEVAKDFRGKPEHDAAQCIACAACAIACPANAITIETDLAAGTRTWEIMFGRCIFCGRCEEVCPTAAIKLSPDFELAVGRKEDLIQSAVFDLAECPSCRRYFAPAKEVAYATEILAEAVSSPEIRADIRRHVATCPECKRKADVEQLVRAGLGRNVEVQR
jgi:hydrogenase-4 component H